jgi:probable HAF family extracellular repeat protein
MQARGTKQWVCRCLLAACALLALWAGVSPAPAGGYSVKDLGRITDVGGRTDSGANGLNESGAVSGVNAINDAYRGLLYGGAWTNLGTLGGSESLAGGLNDSGQVAGYSQTASGTARAFIWSAGGTDGVPTNPQMKELGALDNGETHGYGINNQGEVTGYSDVVVKSKVQQHAFVWRNGNMSDIGTLLSQWPNSFGYAINDSGHVAGTAYNANYSTMRAFLYNGTSAMDIGDLGGDASALTLNGADQVTGYATASGGVDHAFLYASGTMKDLGTLGGHYSYGLGINNGGVIVGGSFIDANDTVYHAFIWSNNVMRDLNGLVDASGAGWVLVEAQAVNDLGQVVGSGAYGGANHVFLLSPAQASTPPQITSADLRGAEMVIRFTTMQNSVYAIEASQGSATGTWTSVVPGVPGTGSIVEVAAPAPAGVSGEFYRVKRTL